MTALKTIRAAVKTVILAAYVKPFLWLTILSLFLFEWVKELTIAICEIYTIAHPTLNKAGKVTYQAVRKLGSVNTPSLYSLTKGGYEKIPVKHGNTINVPNTYHGNLLPHLVLNLSERIPVIGVQIPSAIYPERAQSPAVLLSNPTILIKYQVR